MFVHMLCPNRGSYGAFDRKATLPLLFYYYMRFRGIFDPYKYFSVQEETKFL